jgi:predicted ATP-binding protein involved in virulence
MAGKNAVVCIYDNGVGKAKLLNAVSDLLELFFGVGTGVVSPGFKDGGLEVF